MNISCARKITPEDPPQFPCEMCGTRDDGQPLTRWHTIPSKEWMDIGTKLAVEWHSWRPLSAPRPEGPPEGDEVWIGEAANTPEKAERLVELFHGVKETAPQPAATQPPATGATPETDAAWEAAPPADHGGMTAMRRCSESLETRLHAAEAEVRRLTKKLADEESAHSATVGQRDEAEDAANELTARILGEPIDWSDHDAKWQEAIEAVTPEPEVDSLRAKLALADGLAEEVERANDMHLGRCASSEPFKAQDYRSHACSARDILRAALTAYRAVSVPPTPQAFSPELLTHCLMDDAARQIFKTEARKHVTRDEHSGMVLTVYLHPDGRILVDDISPAATGTKGVAS